VKVDFHGDHTDTCTSLSGATKLHDWMVGVLGLLFRTAGHSVRTQHCVTEAQANITVTWRSATTFRTKRAAGAWSLTCPSRTTSLAQIVTCIRMVCYRIPRTSTAAAAAAAAEEAAEEEEEEEEELEEQIDREGERRERESARRGRARERCRRGGRRGGSREGVQVCG
jgi:hypothetical protein